jgi:flagellar hook-associated protein 1
MSTFSGLSTALSSLHAQRQALEVSGQNVANANTVGYTRQRAELTSVGPQSTSALFAGSAVTGNGVKVADVARLGDMFLDARVRSETANAAFATTRARVYARLESTVAEPSDLGVSHALTAFWAGWQDVGNNPGSTSARAVLLESATALAGRLSTGYDAVATQWSQTRLELTTAVDEVNETAAGVATLNEQIRGVLVSGGSANELVDQRNVMVTSLSRLVGATAAEREDGTMDVMVGGNVLVRGDKAHAVEVSPGSARTLEGTATAGVTLRWSGNHTPVVASGTIMGLATALAPARDDGILAGAAQWYRDTATVLADGVNAVHGDSRTEAGGPGGQFFRLGAAPDDLLQVAVSDVRAIAVAAPDKGALDGSRADVMAKLGTTAGGPDATWSSAVVELGVSSRSAAQRSAVSEATRSTAEKLQLSGASVDIDEESVNMLAHQRAYEGAARVLTAIDEMLDTLINRTGVVGR